MKFHDILSYYVNWDFILSSIDKEPYYMSTWIFRSLPKMFKKSYVLYTIDEKKHIQQMLTDKDVKRLLKKLEEKENIKISEEKEAEILEKAQPLFEL